MLYVNIDYAFTHMYLVIYSHPPLLNPIKCGLYGISVGGRIICGSSYGNDGGTDVMIQNEK